MPSFRWTFSTSRNGQALSLPVIFKYAAGGDTEIPNSEFIIPNYLKAFSAYFPVHDPPCQFIVSPAAFQPDSVFTAYIVLSAG